jgi:hypothetical protein
VLGKSGDGSIPRLIEYYREIFAQLETATDCRLFRRGRYMKLAVRPRWTPLAVHFLAAVGAISCMGPSIIGILCRDIKEYWDPSSDYRRAIRNRMQPIAEALSQGDDVLVLSHSLGTVLSFDFLWELSHEQATRTFPPLHKLAILVTMGSPLADETFKSQTTGWTGRIPWVVRRWVNITAYGDWIGHDGTVADDYERMVRNRQIEEIRDIKICNPARKGRQPNPHNVLGYLRSPSTAEVLASWL